MPPLFEAVGPASFSFQKLKRGEDVFRLWGGELIVSERLVALVNSGGFTGGNFFPSSDTAKDSITSPLKFTHSPAGLELLSIGAANNLSPANWNFWLWVNSEAQKPMLDRMIAQEATAIESKAHKDSGRDLAQLIVQSRPLEVSPACRFGATPFDTEAIGHHHCEAGTIAGHRPLSQLSVIGSSWDGSDLCRTDVYVGQHLGLFRPYQLLIVSRRLLDGLQQQHMKGFQFEVVELV